jgi:hypothetical protein
MTESQLKDYIQPFPDIGDFIFVPPSSGPSRTWIYRAEDDPQLILDFHFSSLMSTGWRVKETSPVIVAERAGSSLSVSTLRRQDGTRVVYEIQSAQNA